MKKNKLEAYLGKKVRVKIFDGDVFEGILKATNDLEFDIRNHYYCECDRPVRFRSSHVIKLTTLEIEK